MSNPNKAKGTAFETAVTRYLKANGTPTAHRVAQTGRDDSGDIHGTSPFILQTKDMGNLADALRIGLAGALKQSAVAGEPFGAAVIKRRNKPIADSYVILDLASFARLLRMLRGPQVWRGTSRPPGLPDPLIYDNDGETVTFYDGTGAIIRQVPAAPGHAPRPGQLP